MPEEQFTSQPSVTISQLVFSDGTSIKLGDHDVILVVGPNNSGKSATLRAIRDKFNVAETDSPVLKSIQIRKRGTTDELFGWIEGWAKRLPASPENPTFAASGHVVHRSQITSSWERSDNSVGQLARWLCHFLSADERLGICNPASAVSLTEAGPTHPIHYLQRNDALELSISSKFKKAFGGVDLIVHRNAGSTVPLHVGERPIPAQDEDRVSLGFIERLEKLPQLHTQGDGMRSFPAMVR